jgi:hypothetical protein
VDSTLHLHTLYCKRLVRLQVQLNLYIMDDVAIARNDPKAVSDFIVLLNDKFQLKDLGPLKIF